MFNSEVIRFNEKNERLNSVTIKDNKTDEETIIPCEGSIYLYWLWSND